MQKIIYPLTALALALVIGCKTPKPMLSNLHHNPYTYATTNDKVIEVRVGLMPLAAPQQEVEKPRLPWDLRDSLPHLLVKTIAAKTSKPEDVFALMSKPITIPASEKKTDKQLPTNYTEYKVRLTFSNVKRYFIDGKYAHPNTRLDFLNTYLTVPDRSNFSFYSIDRLENEFEEIDLGSLARNKSVTFNAKLTATGQIGTSAENSSTSSTADNNSNKNGSDQKVFDEKGNEIGTINSNGEISSVKNKGNTTNVKSGASANATGEVGYQNTETLNEALAIKLRQMKTGFSFSPSEIVISQGGRPNGDISHNVYVNATLKFADTGTDTKRVYNFNNLFGDDNQPTVADDLLFDTRTVNYVKCHNAAPINFTTRFEGKLRAVGNTAKQTGENSLEYDDLVTYYHIPSSPGPSVSINPFLFCKNVYKITARDKAGRLFDLRITWTTDEELDIFSDDKPEVFYQWLIKQMANPKKENLNTKRFELYFEHGASKISITKDSLTANDLLLIKTLNDIRLEVRTN